jgi:hypothetical protein
MRDAGNPDADTAAISIRTTMLLVMRDVASVRTDAVIDVGSGLTPSKCA